MPLAWLDHVNIRTANFKAMVRFYTEVLALKPGARPSFQFNGAWLYCGDRAAVHLVERPEDLAGIEPQIEHFAFRAEGLTDFIAHLKCHEVPYRLATVPDMGLRQVHIHDPDGNHVEIAFLPNEETDRNEPLM